MEVLDVAEDKVSIDTDFGTDLNADSIDVVEILMRLEDRFASKSLRRRQAKSNGETDGRVH